MSGEEARMASQDLVERLRTQPDQWNAWRDTLDESVRLDLSFADLAALDLRALDFHSVVAIGASFRQADLRGANLGNADLRNANLREANLQTAHLDDVRCDNTQFESADLSGASCRDARFCFSDLTRACLQEAYLHQADCSYARCFETDLTRATLTATNWRGTTLHGAILTQAIMGETIFGHTQLLATSGWDTVTHVSPSIIGIDMLAAVPVPTQFWRLTGVPDRLLDASRTLRLAGEVAPTCYLLGAPDDEAFVAHLATALKQHGLACWYYPAQAGAHDLFAGFEQALITACDYLLLVLSPAWEQLAFITSFLANLTGQAHDELPRRIIPLLLGAGDQRQLPAVPPALKGSAPIEVTNWQESTAWNHILQEVLSAVHP
jgi:uncharacterized protein YjbI with pentapeptide repeats